MKKILITLLAALPFLSLPLQSFADKDKGKGPSARAYERANDNASFKRDDNKHRDRDDHEGKYDRESGDDDLKRDNKKRRDRDDHEGMYDRESRDDDEIKSSDEKYKSRKNEKDNKDKKKLDDNS
jgi:hypothetical protein